MSGAARGVYQSPNAGGGVCITGVGSDGRPLFAITVGVDLSEWFGLLAVEALRRVDAPAEDTRDPVPPQLTVSAGGDRPTRARPRRRLEILRGGQARSTATPPRIPRRERPTGGAA